MVSVNLQDYLKILPGIKESPDNMIWFSYDTEADVLYVNYRQSEAATDSELTDDDVIIRYQGDDVIGYTILHASQRERADESHDSG